eukprot:CAMPEP_0202367018 /NCGR_PEP_ID=MMETSP1126-20121109/17404_1 /ASSEMBLY_ACC=CAM_ASM_000457 /TAXON_ID=3047 /ORGANISM="Dunaliella tertiolecta, Strain CCMP1320" /LENGTH=142 /DNA_ID=CAMNT_0048962197 /DNA_START=1207 /DNA_END=1632 /DNA_ORIENTATION=-
MTQTRACTEPRTTKSAGMADAEGHAADTTGMKRGAPQCAVCIVPNSVQHRKGMPLMNTSRAALLRMKRFLPHNQNAWNGNMNTMVRVKTPYSTQKTSAFNHPEPLFLALLILTLTASPFHTCRLPEEQGSHTAAARCPHNPP